MYSVNKSILLIDKDPDVIAIITYLLEDEGYQVIISKKPFDISEVIILVPALILLHNGLNNEGTAICKALKAEPQTLSVPIIMSSTRSDLADIARESCAEGYINKPFDIEDLVALIKLTIRTPTNVH